VHLEFIKQVRIEGEKERKNLNKRKKERNK